MTTSSSTQQRQQRSWKASLGPSSAETIEQRALREVRDMVVETGRTPWWEDPDARVHGRVGVATVADAQARLAR